MEHKHFVTFEQVIMSFPCYETSLFYFFNSETQLSILRIDRSVVDENDVKERTILFPISKPFINEISILKEFLVHLFSYSGSCYGWPCYTKSELITTEDFDLILKEGNNNIDKRKNENREKNKKHPLILFCTEKNLSPEPQDHSPDSWIAKCPSGGKHHIMISTSSPSNHLWGCGYCKKKGGLDELKQWVEGK